MESRVAIITGAGRGIGRAIALELSGRGYSLVLVARTETQLGETARICQAATLAVVQDVADINAPALIVEQAMARFGRVDVLVNNAGFAPLLPVTATTDDLWEQTLAVNLSATFRLCRAAWPMMVGQGGGVIVNISSIATRDPFPGFSAYAAAKAGVNGLTLALAREGHPHGITVHSIAPGSTETEMLREKVSRDVFPIYKTLDPADVARVVAACADGEMKHSSGEVVYLKREP